MDKFDCCKHGNKAQCPEVGNSVMTGLLAKADMHGASDSTPITPEIIEAVNRLCENCSSFEERQ